MTDLTITNVGDAWVNSLKTGLNYGSASRIHVKSGERQGYLLPPLQPIAGRTVLTATLVGRVGSGHAAQTYTVAPITERWSPGRVTWTNKPAVNTAAQVTQAVSALADGGLVSIPVTSILQSVAAGTAWFGLRITTSSTATGQTFYATDSGSPAWELLVTLSDAPDQPSNLRPDGGAVATNKPILAWDFVDLGGDSTEQGEAQVQVDSPAVGAQPNATTPGYDSGWMVKVDPQHDLNAPVTRTVSVTTTNASTTVASAALFQATDVGASITGTGIPNGATITAYASASSVTISAAATASGTVTATLSESYVPPGSPPQSTFWRVRVKDAAGVISEWSDWADYTVSALPTLTINSPVGAFGDPSPQLLATMTGGTLASWKAWATGPDRADVRAETGMRTGAIDWTVPETNADGRRVLRENETGWIYLRAYDTVDRAVAVGQNPYVETWISAALTTDGAVTAPTGLTVTQLATGDPRSSWQWSRTVAADAWLIDVDGVTVRRLDPSEVTANAGVYTWADDRGVVTPLRTHTLKVRAVTVDKSSTGPTVSRAHQVAGVWLIPDTGTPIMLKGKAVGEFARTDRVATYAPLVGPEVDVIYDYTGKAGSFSGGIDSRSGDVWATLDRISAIAKSKVRTCRMVWGSQSMMVRIADLDATPHDDMQPGDLKHRVRFRFVQVGD